MLHQYMQKSLKIVFLRKSSKIVKNADFGGRGPGTGTQAAPDKTRFWGYMSAIKNRQKWPKMALFQGVRKTPKIAIFHDFLMIFRSLTIFDAFNIIDVESYNTACLCSLITSMIKNMIQ